MEDPNSTLLPYILETLSRKPELCDTFDNLCRDIQEQLAQEQNHKYGNVRVCIQRALGVGQSLGIITLTNETIRMPFNFRQGKGSKAPNKSNEEATKAAEAATTQHTDRSQDKNTYSQSQQPQRNQKTPYNSVREEESDYSIMFPEKGQRGMVRTRARSRSTKRKASRGNTRGKSSHRGRRGRGVNRRRTTRYRR